MRSVICGCFISIWKLDNGLTRSIPDQCGLKGCVGQRLPRWRLCRAVVVRSERGDFAFSCFDRRSQGLSRYRPATRWPRGSERGRARTLALCRRSSGRRSSRHGASVCGRDGRSVAACCRLDRTTAGAATTTRPRRCGRSEPVAGRTWGRLPILEYCSVRRCRPGSDS